MRRIAAILGVIVWCTLGRPAAQEPADNLDLLEKAVAADPENLKLGADYRQLAIGRNEFDRAIDLFEKLARRKHSGPNVQISHALAYVDKVPPSGDIRRLYLARDAIKALTKSIELEPGALAYYVRGLINLYFNNLIFHRVPRGIADLERALALTTADTPAALVSRVYVSLGDGYWQNGRRDKAREVWSRGASRFSDHDGLKSRLSSDEDEAARVVKSALYAGTRVDTSLAELPSDR